MTLLGMEGFAGYPVANIPQRGFIGAANAFVAGRFPGSSAMESVGTAHYMQKTVPQSSTLIQGIAFKTGGHVNNRILGFLEGGTWHISITDDGLGRIAVYRGECPSGTKIGTSVDTWLHANTWAHIQAKVYVHDTLGSVEVRVNNVPVLTLTNVDTRNGGNGYMDCICIRGESGNTSHFADWYWLDTNGTVRNDFLGDCRVWQVPVVGNGASADWDGSDGNKVDNYALLDDPSMNSDTDYVSTSTVGAKQLCTVANTPYTGTILGVQVGDWVRKEDAGNTEFKTLLRIGAAEYQGDAFPNNTTYQYVKKLYEQSPASGANFTAAELNAPVQIGGIKSA